MNIALYGSGEFTELVTEIDEYLIQKYNLTNVAVIPTAAGKERDYYKWIETAASHYESIGIEVIRVPIVNNQDANNDQLVNLLDKADWIFFSGGDPKYLFNTINNSKLWDKVIERVKDGALLAGSSAGAMVMGSYLLTNPLKALLSNEPAIWEEAFGMVEYTIIPHYNRVNNHKKIIQRIIKKSPDKVKNSWIGIEENTALIIDNNGNAIKGLGTVEFNR